MWLSGTPSPGLPQCAAGQLGCGASCACPAELPLCKGPYPGVCVPLSSG